MGSGHGVHVIDLAIGSAALVVWSAVPTGKSGFHHQRLAMTGGFKRFFAFAWLNSFGCRFGIF
jgi:hypothetical protein